ncbi:H+/gluconate symporter-like permease [Clostridium acetobutylicum]|nr:MULTISPECIES: hypothetical protein [Clostridium]ADZ21150.1 Conserved hypothetical protein [Clostridium acetobutylicum EA 2018]MBC2394512.1 hypothetical protein [Clostridium acetobutylicum]MBC2583474.1 hypothetical protein [Clostridium acetobutylicum]NOV88816.1 H+/gluconate symporter-like permease [Clostridium acetobutylicum]NOW12843.1 H+/gluconate symporter-like permease [Clostridium acetobutylicum]
MFSNKRIKNRGFSMVYALIIGMLCVLVAFYLYNIECERKKYISELQKSIVRTKNNNCEIYIEDGI